MAEPAARPGARLLSFLLFAAALLVVLEGVRLGALDSPSSPGAFPLLAGLTMAGAAVAIGLGRRAAPADRLTLLPGRVAAAMALLVGFVAAMPLIGFHSAAFLFLAAAISLLRRRLSFGAVLIAAASVVAVHLVFRLAFTVLLPEGTLWR
ncbi:tripartite tricarboxylate transporter TctB family protein [Elioraea sp.]|uniref:tripartite tricarboxylate transporter TctB family protein n=1 Tax=Elioraea sp. TaxID=2185103 RepID=UPI00307FCBCF